MPTRYGMRPGFIMMNMEGYPHGAGGFWQLSTDADKWILSKGNRLAEEVTANMDKYELGIAVQKIYDFIWEEFCDWYIEMVKPRLYNRGRIPREMRLCGR